MRLRKRKRLTTWALGGALLLSLWFGLAKAGQVSRLSTEVENKYMAAFHRLKWASEELEERLALLQAAQDAQLQLFYLADMRVLAAQAVEQMTTLPLLTLHLPHVGQFLQELQTDTDHMHALVASGYSLTDEELGRMNYLHQKATRLEFELGELGEVVAPNLIHWSDTVKETDPTVAAKRMGPIVEAMHRVDDALKAVRPTQVALYQESSPVDLGAHVSAAEAVGAAKSFLDQPLAEEPTVAAPGAPGNLPVYYVAVTKVTGTKLTLGVSVSGGKVIFALDGRPVVAKTQEKIALVTNAKELFTKWGYGKVQLLRWEENAGTLVMDFAPEQDGVLLLTDQLQMTLAMDNGELVGFDARAYWQNHRPRKLTSVALTAAEAAQHAANVVDLMGAPRQVLTKDWRGRERLAWEATGEQNGALMTIHLDAETGQELRILRQSQQAIPAYDALTAELTKSE